MLIKKTPQMRKNTRKALISKAAVSDRIFKRVLVRLGSGSKVSDFMKADMIQ